MTRCDRWFILACAAVAVGLFVVLYDLAHMEVTGRTPAVVTGRYSRLHAKGGRSYFVLCRPETGDEVFECRRSYEPWAAAKEGESVIVKHMRSPWFGFTVNDIADPAEPAE